MVKVKKRKHNKNICNCVASPCTCVKKRSTRKSKKGANTSGSKKVVLQVPEWLKNQFRMDEGLRSELHRTANQLEDENIRFRQAVDRVRNDVQRIRQQRNEFREQNRNLRQQVQHREILFHDILNNLRNRIAEENQQNALLEDDGQVYYDPLHVNDALLQDHGQVYYEPPDENNFIFHEQQEVVEDADDLRQLPGVRQVTQEDEEQEQQEEEEQEQQEQKGQEPRDPGLINALMRFYGQGR